MHVVWTCVIGIPELLYLRVVTCFKVHMCTFVYLYAFPACRLETDPDVEVVVQHGRLPVQSRLNPVNAG